MRGLVLVIALSVGLVCNGQNTYWMEAMGNSNANYFKACQSFHDYWKGKEKEKHTGYKQFERWCNAVQPYVNADGSIGSYKLSWEKAVAYHHQNGSRSANGNWIEVGPWTEDNYSRGVGRLTTMAFHPTDSNTFYVGSPSGGVWITHDDGKTWFNPKDDIMNFGVSSICIDRKNPDHIFIGTGDADGLDTDGTGVYKSEDGGKTWTKKNTGMNDQTVTKLIMDPDSSNILIATTRRGIFRSIDSGNSWSHVHASGDFRDLEAKPDDFNTLYAGQWSYPGNGSYIYVSHNKGVSWSRRFITEGLFPDMRYEIEVTPSEPNVLFGVGETKMVISENAGDSFKTHIDSGAFLLHRDAQGWYNASFKIDPDNPQVMYCGNQRLYKSYDKGIHWIRLNHTHADNHYIDFHPITKALYVLDDGGIHRSKDGGQTFEDLTNLGVAAIYRVAQSPFDPNHNLQGYQDCGSKYYDGYKWTSVYGADGMQPLYDPTDSLKFYTAMQYGRIIRHLKHIGSAQSMAEPEDEGGWVTPYILDATDNSVMYSGRESAWMSTNIHTSDRRKVTWKNISNGPAKNVGRYLRLKQQRGNPKRLMAIVQNSNRSNSLFIKCDNVYDTNYVWTTITTPIPAREYADFETDATDSLKIWLIVNNNVYLSKDGGTQFQDIKRNLPDVPHHCLKLDTATGNLYLGSDAGAFVLMKGDSLWTSFSTGLGSSARVRDLDIYYAKSNHSESKLVAATYGRGLWESDLIGASSNSSQASSAYISSKLSNHTFDSVFTVWVDFKRHLWVDSVSGFADSKIQIQNGSVIGFSQQGKRFKVEIKATAYGKVLIDVPDAAATSLVNGASTKASTRTSIDYLPKPIQLGPDGPGGVGDSASLMLWLKADHIFTDTNGDTLNSDGTKIDAWHDYSGKQFKAVQTTDSSRPFLRLDSNGIAGWPAVEYRPPNRFLRVFDFGPVGRDLTVFAIAQSNTPKWTGHSWIANSREHNGFLLHNSNNANSIYGNVLDSNRSYMGTPSVDWPTIQEPHVYALQYNERMWKNHIYLDDRVGIDYINRDRYRNGEDSITIRLGKDTRERYGNGKLGEFIYYKEDLGRTKRIIVGNYLAAKYGVNLQTEKRYSTPSNFKYNVAGIGFESELDYHISAKGGDIWIDKPQEIESGNYLLWGHNSESLIWDSIKTGNGYLSKRIYAVSESGDFGKVRLRIDTAVIQSTGQLGIKIGDLNDLSNPRGGRTYVMQKAGKYYEIEVDFSDGENFAFITGKDLFFGIEENNSLASTNIFPNPSKNGHGIVKGYVSKDTPLKIEIRDIQGKLIFRINRAVTEGWFEQEINVNEAPFGTYLVTISTESSVQTLRWIK